MGQGHDTGHQIVKKSTKKFENAFTHFDAMHERDRRTDRGADKHAPHSGIRYA